MSNTRVHTNFSAGPAALPTAVIKRFTAEFDTYQGSGYSIAECSHRSSLYKTLHLGTINKIRRVLAVPPEYEVLLLSGGATTQFALLGCNFAHQNGARYCVTGAWSKKAYQDATRTSAMFTAPGTHAAHVATTPTAAHPAPTPRPPRLAYDGHTHTYTRLPQWSEVTCSDDDDYLHLTSNETIHGIQFKQWPDARIKAPLIVDMSSDIMTKPLPLSRFAMIYASAQKNIGVAGVTVVIIRRSFLAGARDDLPPAFSYKTHAAHESLYHTPPTVSIFSVHLVMDWIIEQGGLTALNTRNLQKAGMLYSYIDAHQDFYRNRIAAADRSTINAIFTLPTKEITTRFLAAAERHGIIGINGHRSVGGCRVSLYNAIERTGVEILLDFMDRFIKTA